MLITVFEFLQFVFDAGEEQREPHEPVAVRLVLDLARIHPDLGNPVQAQPSLLAQWRTLAGAYAAFSQRPEAGQLHRGPAQDHEKTVEIAKEQARLDAHFGATSQCHAELITEPARAPCLIIRREVARVEERPPPAVDDFTGIGIFSWPTVAQRLVGTALLGPHLVTVVVQQFLEAVHGEQDVTALASTTGGTKPL